MFRQSPFEKKSRLRRGYTLEVTPVPIPNTAVKLQRADDTASDRGGKVGRRDVKIESPREIGGFLRFYQQSSDWLGTSFVNTPVTRASKFRPAARSWANTWCGITWMATFAINPAIWADQMHDPALMPMPIVCQRLSNR